LRGLLANPISRKAAKRFTPKSECVFSSFQPDFLSFFPLRFLFFAALRLCVRFFDCVGWKPGTSHAKPQSRKKITQKSQYVFSSFRTFLFSFPLRFLFFAALRGILRLSGLKTRNVSRKAAKKSRKSLNTFFHPFNNLTSCFPSVCVIFLRLCGFA
jgi:hypothetical protein